MTQSFQIQTSALYGLDELLDELGLESDDWLNSFGLTTADIKTEQKTMDIGVFVNLLQKTAEKTQCKNLGLRLGAKQDFRILGPLGLLLQNCHTPRDALNAARGFMWFHNQTEYWDYSIEGHDLHLRRYEIFHDMADTRQYKELSLSACYQLCKLLMGSDFKGVRLAFSHAPISTKKTYEQHFNMPVHFNCEYDALVVPSQYLDVPIPNANQALKGFAHEYLKTRKKHQDQDIEQQVVSLIQQTMSTQHPTIENIAELLHMSKRTLQRRLKDKGLVFKQLLSETRIKTAKWYLASSQIDITLLSDILGYHDVSALSRAFKQATQVPPLQWRKQSATSS